MRHPLVFVLVWLVGTFAGPLVPKVYAQNPTTLEGWADRLRKFGSAIPQEKVYVHMDNTCYFLGDTIWYKAYTRRTDKGIPSSVSRVLYAELYNQDGYLVERQLVEMKNGEGCGCFALPDTLYGGYYELRAYTRWQLNWGQTQHPHTDYAERWFFSKAMAREYYRDYEKLYSRVFPVYDKPKADGEFYHDMTLRPLRRYYAKDEDHSRIVLSLYPEGGQLVEGVEGRLAFEAVTEEGEWSEGTLAITTNRDTVAQTQTVSRGRGVVTFTPQSGMSYHATFIPKEGKVVGMDVKHVVPDGVALQVHATPDEVGIDIRAAGSVETTPLAFTIMHEGVVEVFREIQNSGDPEIQNSGDPNSQYTLSIPTSSLRPGVNQITVFDAQGRVYADRLFFVGPNAAGDAGVFAPIQFTGVKDQYEPFEKVDLDIQTPATTGAATISLAIRDAATRDYVHDSGNLLTEMLLASEVRGFVPSPGYFFEADDDEHRQALDLLMMTQGWRRFDWTTMATPGRFTLTHPYEYTQVLNGVVHNYTAQMKEDVIRQADLALHEKFHDPETDAAEDNWGDEEETEEVSPSEQGYADLVNSLKSTESLNSQYRANGDLASARFHADEGHLKREVRVHAEFTQPGSESIVGDVDTQRGMFRIETPNIPDRCVFFLAASDTTHWQRTGSGTLKEPTWVNMDEEEYPEFYVRLNFPYPRFVKPYTYYQTHLAVAPDDNILSPEFAEGDATLMNAVTVRAKRGGQRAFDASKPAFVLDAYQAFNESCDAGLCAGWYTGSSDFFNNIARTYIGDMNIPMPYTIEQRLNTRNSSFHISEGTRNKYNNLYNLDKVYVYTDYSPRREGSRRFDNDQPEVIIDLRMYPDESRRTTYRDRRYVLPGFAQAEEFYHPDYTHQRPQTDGQGPADYRRTLYWNPNVPIDASGQAHISFFMGSRQTGLDISADGQASNGTLLTLEPGS